MCDWSLSFPDVVPDSGKSVPIQGLTQSWLFDCDACRPRVVYEVRTSLLGTPWGDISGVSPDNPLHSLDYRFTTNRLRTHSSIVSYNGFPTTPDILLLGRSYIKLHQCLFPIFYHINYILWKKLTPSFSFLPKPFKRFFFFDSF